MELAVSSWAQKQQAESDEDESTRIWREALRAVQGDPKPKAWSVSQGRVIGTVAFFVPEVLRMKLIQRDPLVRYLYVFEQMTWDKAEAALLIHKSIEVEAGVHEYWKGWPAHLELVRAIGTGDASAMAQWLDKANINEDAIDGDSKTASLLVWLPKDSLEIFKILLARPDIESCQQGRICGADVDLATAMILMQAGALMSRGWVQILEELDHGWLLVVVAAGGGGGCWWWWWGEERHGTVVMHAGS
eukprot:Skav201249  [mRNA]  locus=scaffold3106:159803:168651:- [translate_table: standard]